MNPIKIFKDADELAAAACDYMLRAAEETLQGYEFFNIALTGGSTPRKLYELLAQQREIDWANWRFFMGDERFVPQHDERSNQHLAQVTLLDNLKLSAEQVHPVPVDKPSPKVAAQAYDREIRNHFRVEAPDVPRFDLILLGMGSDTHTASLFPGEPSLKETEKLVTWSEPGVLPPPVDRVTFTLPLINAGHRVLFMTTGADKTEAFAKVLQDLEKDPAEAVTPAGMVRPVDGELHWFVDQAAAG